MAAPDKTRSTHVPAPKARAGKPATGRLAEGQKAQEQRDAAAGDALLKSVADNIAGRTICAFGEAAAWPVQGFLRHFWHEFEYYIAHGRSLVDAELGVAA